MLTFYNLQNMGKLSIICFMNIVKRGMDLSWFDITNCLSCILDLMPCQSGIDPCPFWPSKKQNGTWYFASCNALQTGAKMHFCGYRLMYSHLNPPAKITQLLFCPQSDDFSWILFAEAILETVVILDVTIPGLKFIQGCFEHFHCTLMGHRFCLPPFEPNKKTTTNIISFIH